MQKPYRILLSAYACDPYKGSEPGVGWNWAIQIAKRGHHVWVVTRKKNKRNIDLELNNDKFKELNLRFIYYDIPKSISFWKTDNFGVRIYYFLWQICIYFLVKKYCKKIHFDFIHHITFVSNKFPSFISYLNISFVAGPVGGGEMSTKNLINGLCFKYRFLEYFRNLSNYLVRYSPLNYYMYKKARLIISTTTDTKKTIPGKFNFKNFISLAIGINQVQDVNKKFSQSNISFLYLGRLTYWKGIHLAIKAYIESRKEMIKSEFTIIGKGNFKAYLKKISSSYGKDLIQWIDWISRTEVELTIKKHDVLIFPSFHDSGGMVVLEALSNGLPVICLDLGGPAEIVNDTCGRVIITKGKQEYEIIQDLCKAMLELGSNHELLQKLSIGALNRVKDFTWEKTVGRVYTKIENLMFEYEYYSNP